MDPCPTFSGSSGRFYLYWGGLVVLIALAIVTAGAVVAGAFWSVFGPFLGSDCDLLGRLSSGASVGARYARVWAGGFAIILCFMKAHHGFSLRAWWRARRR
jgi:hypothetical protein